MLLLKVLENLVDLLSINNAENVCATGIVYDENGYANYGTVIFDKDGNYIYDDIYDGGYGTDEVHDLAVDVNGNFYVTGDSPGNGTENDYATVKYINSGNRLATYKNQQINNKINSTVPKEYTLKQNYPNPFNPTTTVEYQITNNGNVSLKIFDILGQEVATLVDEYKLAGYYSVTFNGSKLPSGIYIYEIRTRDFRDVKKMILIK